MHTSSQRVRIITDYTSNSSPKETDWPVSRNKVWALDIVQGIWRPWHKRSSYMKATICGRLSSPSGVTGLGESVLLLHMKVWDDASFCFVCAVFSCLSIIQLDTLDSRRGGAYINKGEGTTPAFPFKKAESAGLDFKHMEHSVEYRVYNETMSSTEKEYEAGMLTHKN